MNASDAYCCDWEEKKDPRSGRLFYKNRLSGERVWVKPLEISSGAERQQFEIERKSLRDFFNEMEENVKNKLSHQNLISKKASDDSEEFIPGAQAYALLSGGSLHCSGTPHSTGCAGALIEDNIDLVRRKGLILYRDGFFVHELKHNSGHGERCKCTLPLSIQVTKEDIQRLLSCKCCSPSGGTSKRKVKVGPTQLKRRNSTGTLHIADTISVPDRYSTILAVCFVINAHMFSSLKNQAKFNIPEYAVFDDRLSSPRNGNGNGPPSPRVGSSTAVAGVGSGGTESTKIPPLDQIAEFFIYLFNKTQLENDCMIIALLYLERVMVQTRGRLSIRMNNWKSLIFACLVMASKVWDDLSMWNVDFSQVICGFGLARVNELETALLFALDYDVRVSASTYAKYYFYLRSISSRFNLGKKKAGATVPLNFLQAKKLQIVTENYGISSHFRHLMSRHTRRPSFNGFDLTTTSSGLDSSENSTKTETETTSSSAEASSAFAAAGTAARVCCSESEESSRRNSNTSSSSNTSGSSSNSSSGTQTGMRSLLPPGMSLPLNLCIEQIVSTQHTHADGTTYCNNNNTGINPKYRTKGNKITPSAVSDYIHTPVAANAATDVAASTIMKADCKGEDNVAFTLTSHDESGKQEGTSSSPSPKYTSRDQRPRSWDAKRSSVL